MRGGIRLIEITFDQRGAPEDTANAIRLVAQNYSGDVCVGAGTVMATAQLAAAIAAGANYIISPNVNLEVIHETKRSGLVSIPGALTPSEIACAHENGADFVKVFPASAMGLEYIKAIRAPVSNIPLLAVGGITEGNIADYMAAGIVGFGIGSNIVKNQWVQQERYEEITRLAGAYLASVRQASSVQLNGVG